MSVAPAHTAAAWGAHPPFVADASFHASHPVVHSVQSSAYVHAPVGNRPPPHHGIDTLASTAGQAERDLAGVAAHERSAKLDASRHAYDSGDKALAHKLSEEGHAAGLACAHHNALAADLYFAGNNGHFHTQYDDGSSIIDLHGLHVDEAIVRVKGRITDTEKTHAHLVIIHGKGIHSVDHVTHIKPAVTELVVADGFAHKCDFNDLHPNEGCLTVLFTPGQGAVGVHLEAHNARVAKK